MFASHPVRDASSQGCPASLPLRRAVLLAVLVICAGRPGTALTAAEASSGAAADANDGVSAAADSPAEKAAKQRTATAMVYVVVGIAVVGITLIVLIILSGHRLRQRARSRTSRAPDLDPLWYLRPAARRERGARAEPSPGGTERPTPPPDGHESPT
jgi:hypothetical protein